MHDLPLVVSETSGKEKETKEVLLMVDEVMSNTDHSQQQDGRTCSVEVRSVSWIKSIYWQSCKGIAGKKQSQYYEGIYFRNWFILDLFDRHLFEHLPFDCAIEPIFFIRKSVELAFGLSYVVFFENLPCLVLVEVVSDEEVSHILPLSHGEPVGSTGMRVNERVEIIEFVLYYPQIASICFGQFSISLRFLLQPIARIAFDTSRRHWFPILLNLIDFHGVFVVKI